MFESLISFFGREIILKGSYSEYILGLSSPVSDSFNWIVVFFADFLRDVLFPRVKEIVFAPITTPDLMWIVVPLVIATILMQLYFGRHINEELGWSSAFGNNIVIIFVSVNLLQRIYGSNNIAFDGIIEHIQNPKLIFVIGISLISLIQLVLNYFHAMPKKLSFFVNSSVPNNLIAYSAIIFVYTSIPIDFISLFAVFFIFIIFLLIFEIEKKITPKSDTAIQFIRNKKKKAKEMRQKFLEEKIRKENIMADDFSNFKYFLIFLIVQFFSIILLQNFVVSLYPFTYFMIELLRGLSFIVFFIVFIKRTGISMQGIYFNKKISNIFYGLFFGFLFYFFIILFNFTITNILPKPLIERFNFEFDFLINTAPFLWNRILIFISNCILIPMGSELFFRGIFTSVTKSKFEEKTTLLLSSMLFILTYLNIWVFLGVFSFYKYFLIFFFGLFAGLIREKLGLESAVSMHIAINLLGFITAFM